MATANFGDPYDPLGTFNPYIPTQSYSGVPTNTNPVNTSWSSFTPAQVAASKARTASLQGSIFNPSPVYGSTPQNYTSPASSYYQNFPWQSAQYSQGAGYPTYASPTGMYGIPSGVSNQGAYGYDPNVVTNTYDFDTDVNAPGSLAWTRYQQYQRDLANASSQQQADQLTMQWNQQQLAWEQEKFNRQMQYQQQQDQLAQQTQGGDEQWRYQQLAQQKAQSEAELAWQRELWGLQSAEEQKQRLATLAANPMSWLEYASQTNQAPVIQPWMLPLMPQQYSNLQVGQQIPGWTAQNMTGMPDLITPSAQLLARMGPTAQAQYQGYQRADQGQMPNETEFRLWSQAPPGGSTRLVQQR